MGFKAGGEPSPVWMRGDLGALGGGFGSRVWSVVAPRVGGWQVRAPPPAPPRGCTSGCPQTSRRVPCSIPRAPDLADRLGVHFRGSCEI